MQTLYGTTYLGGPYNDGVVFSVPVTGGTPTVMAPFNGTDGRYSESGDLTLSGSTLYGATDQGGANGDGTVFAINLPEPGSTGLLAIGSLALLRRVRRIANRTVAG